MTIQGLAGATIWSEDLNKNLLPFYRDTVGIPVRMETPGFVLLGAQSQAPLCLGTHSEVHGKSKEPQRFIVQMNTDDIRGEYSRLRGKGVEFLEEPKDDGGPVMFCTFKDPEGNFIQLIQEK